MSNRRYPFLFCLCLSVLTLSCGTAGRSTGRNGVETGADLVDIGYEKTGKDGLSYSVTSLKPTSEEMVYTNMYDYLRGRVAGLSVGPGNSSIQIRGKNSINASTEPLILVDGMETDLDAVNPSDVYSVSVLKDSSASIYGVRGANGVILITTKQGRQMEEAQAQARKKARAERRAARAAKKK